MKFLLVAVSLSACLAACSNATSPAASALKAPGHTGMAVSGDTLPSVETAAVHGPDAPARLQRMPSDACSLDGYRSFFEAIVYDAALRSAYATPAGSAVARDFRIALVDNRWVLLDPHGGPERPAEMRIDRQGHVFGAAFRAAAAAGQPAEAATYRFVFEDGCWRLDGLQR